MLDRIIKSLDQRIVIDWSTSAEEAIQLIQSEKKAQKRTPYDLIVADIYLDGLKTGLDLMVVCCEIYPEIPFVLTSVNDISHCMNHLECSNYEYFLKKPFNPVECKKIFKAILWRNFQGNLEQ